MIEKWKVKILLMYLADSHGSSELPPFYEDQETWGGCGCHCGHKPAMDCYNDCDEAVAERTFHEIMGHDAVRALKKIAVVERS
jgi:hypothetical protein